jgi:hypothetical protein
VAGLAPTGLASREIAERMGISLRIAEANLSRVYRQLGVRSRAGLARDFGTRRPQLTGRRVAHIVYRRFRAARSPSSALPVQLTSPASIRACGSMRPQASCTNVSESVVSSTSGRSM